MIVVLVVLPPYPGGAVVIVLVVALSPFREGMSVVVVVVAVLSSFTSCSRRSFVCSAWSVPGVPCLVRGGVLRIVSGESVLSQVHAVQEPGGTP